MKSHIISFGEGLDDLMKSATSIGDIDRYVYTTFYETKHARNKDWFIRARRSVMIEVIYEDM